MPEQKQQIYAFDNFRLDVPNRELLLDGTVVALPAKAFDMLVVLIENGGRLVEKDELFNRVWPDQIVEESNLTVQVSAIRKALGEQKDNPRYIATVSGHGYRFTGNLIRLDEEEEEVVIERHAMSRLSVETESETESAAGAEDNALAKKLSEVGHLTPRDEVATSKHTRVMGWRTLLFAGLVVISISAGIFLVMKRSRSLNKSASSAPIKSIAVLPFKPLVAGSRDESLEMGMAETLIMRLSSLQEIKVPPTNAVRKFGGLEQDAVAAGRELQVESVLDGNIQKAGDRLRVTVRLVRVADGQTLWTERFDENFTDIFAVQDRVSEKVVGLLAVRLTEQEQMLLTKRNTDNPQAYELYLKGNYSSGTEERLKKNIEFFQRAIKLDPGYALAYAGLADSYMKLGGNRGFLAPRETFPKAKEPLMKTLEIDETLAEGHALLATYKLDYEWDWSGAEREFKRAIQLDPNDSGAHERYGSYLQSMGRFDEALAERKLAQKFDPINPAVIASVGHTLFIARRYDEATEQYRKALELNPNYSWGHLWIAEVYVQKGMHEEAISEVNKALSVEGNTRAIAVLGYAYALAGRRDEARKVLGQLEELSKRKYVPSFFFAIIHIGLGEKDQAFEWLEKAYQERNPHLVNLKVQPVFDPIRSDPRFANLVRRVGL